MINVAKPPVIAAVAMSGCRPRAALAVVVALSDGAAAGFKADGDRERRSVLLRVRNWAKFSSLSTNKSPGGPISLNKSDGGSQGAEGIIYWTSFPNGDYADPCARLLGRSVGRSAAALAAAVATAPRTKLVKGPSDVTLGGHPAKFVWLKVRKQIGCEPGFFYKWEDEQGGELWPRTPAGSTIRVWILDVDGTRLFIAAVTLEQATLRPTT